MCVTPTNIFSKASIPQELILKVFSLLSPNQLLELKSTCNEYKDLIESDLLSQARIAELFLIKKPSHANIPLGDLKYFLNNSNLSLEINRDANVFHLTNDLTPIIPWINNLIVKNCETDHLKSLIDLLKKNNRLSTFLLYKCKINEECIKHLKDLLQNTNKKQLNISCCNTVWDKESDSLFFATGEFDEIKLVSEKEAHQFNIENLESDNNGLEEFEKQVSNPDASPIEVLRVFDLINHTVRATVVASIWHSILMNPYDELKPIDHITNQARQYIENNPHHPAVICAATTSKQQYSQILQPSSWL